MKNKLGVVLRLSAAVAITLGNVSAWGFRADEPLEPTSEKIPAKVTPPPRAVARSLAPDQREAARLAGRANVQVDWHPETGLPTSIRGKNLGARREYSGGRGLLVRGGTNNVEHDTLAVMDNLSRFYRIRNATNEFSVARKDSDKLGFRHVRLTQKHRGLTVVGGEVIVHFDKDGDAYQVSGQYVPDLALETAPALSADRLVELAEKDLAASGKGVGQLAERPALVIYARQTEPRLAYEIILDVVNEGAAPARWKYFIDANTGAVLIRFNDIKKIAAPTANGATAAIVGNILSGEGGEVANVNGWRENTGIYYLHSPNRKWTVYNVATSGWADNNTYSYRAIGDWGGSDPSAMSAARNFDIVQRYYLEVHGRNSFNNSGIMALANVHEGNNFVNAYWDGTAFTFGDGDGVDALSLATLDICGHEYTHAVTEYTANLVYQDEPGALNESFSDIMGSCIEFYAQPDGRDLYPGRSAGLADWLCGEDCWLSSTALRDLRDPANAATVGAGNEQPTRYKGSHWYSGSGDNGGVHQNSGVQNFFFYLLSEGGTGVNDGITYNVAGIGITNAGQVAYRALTVYCTENTDYQAVRSAWLSAALDLNPAWATTVAHAWSATGVGTLRVVPEGAISFRGPVGGPHQPQSQTLTLMNRGSGSMTWTGGCSESWAALSSSSGVIPVGSSAAAEVQLTIEALALPAGVYTNRVTFTNDLEPATVSREIVLLVGQAEYYTEAFENNDFDLTYTSLLFTPLDAQSYSLCRAATSGFPVDPSGGNLLALDDDSSVEITLSGVNTVALYQRRSGTFFIGSNGYLTFDTGDSSYDASVAEHFSLPRVSALFNDLDPSSGGSISWKETAEAAVITVENVPEYGSDFTTANFQIEMFFDGRIRITHLGTGVANGIVGLSQGGGVPGLFVEYDLSVAGECPPPDALVVNPFSGWSSEGYSGGPFSPDRAVWTITNVGGDAVNWSAGANQPWLGVTPSSGTLAPGEFVEVTASLNAAASSLPSGVYSAVVSLANLDSGIANDRSALLTVKPLPAAPEPPFNPGPIHNATNVSVHAPLAWNASGIDRVFHLFMGTDSGDLSLVASNLTVASWAPDLLEFNTTYYWRVVVSNVTGVAIGPIWQFTTTVDEVRFSVASQLLDESAGTAFLSVLRENPNGPAISVQYTTTNGSAVAGGDYTGVSGTLEFPPGVMNAEIQVPVIDDVFGEVNETFHVVLRQPSAGVLISTPGSMAITLLDNESETVSLPITLYDGGNYAWDIQRDGVIEDGTSDAFDDAFMLDMFPYFSTAQLVGGREVVIGPEKFGELDVSRRIFVPGDNSYARFLEVIHNPTGGPITTNFWIFSDVGSDLATVVVGTSSGDASFSVLDNWIVTDDADGGLSDPTVVHVIANDHGSIRPASVYHDEDFLAYQYRVTVPPGETKIIMHFGAQNVNRASALTKAAQLAQLQLDALEQIAPEDIVRIVNFGVPTGVRSFAWSAIDPTQQVNVPFAVTVTALDGNGTVASNFNSSVIVRAQSDIPVFFAGFDSGMDGFSVTADPNATSNLWHRTTHRSASGTHSQYYGHENAWNYSTGTNRNAGNLQSSAISLAGAPAPFDLSFKYLLATESSTSYDEASVQISTNNGADWITIGSRMGENPLRNTTAFTNWNTDLSAYAGTTVLLRFNFDTIDQTQNTTEGWYVDDVSIRSLGTTFPLNQSVIGPFVNGVWTGNLAVLQAGTTVYLHCEDDQGNGGDSAAFAIIDSSPPGLAWQRLPGGAVQLLWNGAGYKLQVQFSTLNEGLKSTWQDYPGGNASPVTVPENNTNSVLFFRLAPN